MSDNTDQKLNLKSVRLWVIATIIIGLFIAAYSWNLNSYVPGFSASEVESVRQSQAIDLQNMVDAPYKMLQNLSTRLIGLNGWGVRAPSVLIGLASVLFFYLIMRQLTNRNITAFATVMFAGSSWMLTISRLGDSTITNVIWPIAIMLVAYNVYKFHLAWYWYLIAGVVLGTAVYTPRMIYFVVFVVAVAVFVFHRYEAKMHKMGALLGLAAMVALATPLAYSLFINQTQISELLVLPFSLEALMQTPQQLLSSASNLFWQADLPLHLNLADLPLLNIVELSLALLGLLVIFTDIRAPRGWLILAMLAGGIVALGFDPGNESLFLILPILSIMSGLGLFTLWTRWRELFPKNQAARGLAIALLAIVVLFSSSYHFERYYLGWSRVPETQQTFSRNLVE